MPDKGYRNSIVAVVSPEGYWHSRKPSVYSYFPGGRNGVSDQVVIFSL